MKTFANPLRGSRSGFNLVEMAIALVVVAIGIVSIIGLFPNQLEAVRKTNQRTQMAQLAMSIDNGLRGLGAVGIDYMTPPLSGTLPMPSPANAGGRWIDPVNGNPALVKLNGTKSKIQLVDPNVAGMVNQSMWYSVKVASLQPGTTAPNGLIGRKVTIDLWPGDHQNAPTTPPVETFITEIYQR